MLVYGLVVAALLLCVVHVLINYSKKARMMRKIPGPKETFLIGNALDIIVSPVELFALGRKYANTWKNLYRFWAYPLSAVNIYNPEDIEVIISTMKYNEKSQVYSFLKPWLQDGLLLSHGAKWQQRRKILTPAFHFNILREFYVVLEENSDRLVSRLERHVGEELDVVPVMSEFTLNSICETAMGTQLSEETSLSAKRYKGAILALVTVVFERFIKMPYYFDTIFNLSPLGKQQQKYIDTIRDFTKKVIHSRKLYWEKNKFDINNFTEEGSQDLFMNKRRKKTAMLDLLIAAEKEGLIDETGIQEEVDTFMFEGHDTTASGLTFCLMLLANNKDKQDKIVQELHEIFGQSLRSATIDDLSKMKYLECCIKESLRLYPPVHFISRNLNETVQLSNYTVPPGTLCHIHVYDLHRRGDLYKDPEKFDPDRFSPENCIGRHPYAYIPFSAGPRNCIGQKFAMLEMKLVVSALLREYQLYPVTTPADIKISADLVLRNSGPVSVRFEKRSKNNNYLL
ncbi:cytochrome P450 4C1-like [Plodia interpunctella]|uniref:cytochrome P450 4C1-like n=1 Tax=Plodia interpunctella TaxID=58824 RepID=UPI002368D8D7|nr:cytochrome P450 4C1-like [Plodia interpunctella]